MYFFSFLSLLFSIILIIVSYRILQINKKLFNVLYSILLFFIAMWGIIYSFIFIEKDKNTIWILYKTAAFFFVFATAIFVHIIFLLAHRNTGKKSIIHYMIIGAVYLMATYYYRIYLVSHLMVTDFIFSEWGTLFIRKPNISVYIPYLLYVHISYIIFTYYIIKWKILKTKINPNNLKQTKIIFYVNFISVFLALIINNYIPFFIDRPMPSIGHLAFIVTGIFYLYAMKKYDLFILTPTIAVNEILSKIKVSLFLIDYNDEIIATNLYSEELIGLKKNELKGQKIENIFIDKEQILNFINLQHDNNFDNEKNLFMLRGKLNLEIPVRVSISSFIRNRDLLGHLLVCHDIRNEKELKKAYAELEELTKMKDEFVAIASHDLRAPTAVIIEFCNILLMDKSLPQDTIKIIEIIQNTAHNQLDYTDEILGTVLLNRLGLNLNIEKTSISEMIKSCVKNFSVLANKKNITLTITDNKIINDEFYLDSVKINQVINNLLSNAIKFSNPNCKIIVSYCLLENNDLEIKVQDCGKGINTKTLNKLFSEDVASNYGTAGEKGTGLGLSICKRFVELHKGKIGANSKEGEGSTFWFTIPNLI